MHRYTIWLPAPDGYPPREKVFAMWKHLHDALSEPKWVCTTVVQTRQAAMSNPPTKNDSRILVIPTGSWGKVYWALRYEFLLSE